MKSLIKENTVNLLKRFTDNNLCRFRDLHKDEECYIFGNGPSINWMDLSNFKDKISICTGQMHYHKDFEELDSRYFLLMEPWIFSDTLTRKIFASSAQSKIADNHKLIANDYLSFMNRDSNKNKEFFVSLSNYFHLRNKNINFVYKSLPVKSSKIEELSLQESFSGSFSASLSFAYYLGFKVIHLIGFDAMTLYPSLNERYFEKKKEDNINNKPIKDSFLYFLENKLDISIICHNSSSNILKTKEYEDFFKVKAVYKENHEIISKIHLDLLHSSGYKVF